MSAWDKPSDDQIPQWVIKLMIGLAATGLLLFLARAAMIHYFVQAEVEEFNHTLQSFAVTNAQAVEMSRQHQLQIERERTRQKALELQKMREESRLQAEEAERFYQKELAWEKFYKRSKVCETPPTTADLIECGNEYMRARKRFEIAWEKRSSGG